LLKTLAPSVRTNEGDFRAFVLAVEYLDGVFWRESAIREHASAKSPTQAESAALIDEIAGRDRKLAVALSADWDTGRFPDAPAKTAPLYGNQPKDQLVFQFNRAAAYSVALARRPARFFELWQSPGFGAGAHTP
jgi:hypothetical protein